MRVIKNSKLKSKLLHRYIPVCLITLVHLIIKNTGACGVMVMVVGNGHGDTSSNPGRNRLHFT